MSRRTKVGSPAPAPAPASAPAPAIRSGSSGTPTPAATVVPTTSTTTHSGTDITAIQKSVEKIPFLNNLKEGIYRFNQELLKVKANNPLVTVSHVKGRMTKEVWNFLKQNFATSLDLSDENNVNWKDFVDNLQQLVDSYKLNQDSVDNQLLAFDIAKYVSPTDHE